MASQRRESAVLPRDFPSPEIDGVVNWTIQLSLIARGCSPAYPSAPAASAALKMDQPRISRGCV